MFGLVLVVVVAVVVVVGVVVGALSLFFVVVIIVARGGMYESRDKRRAEKESLCEEYKYDKRTRKRVKKD